jgi:HK97 gp10 family phage protein
MAETSVLRLKVEGLNKLTRAMRKAGVEVKDMKEANRKVGDVVVRRASPLTPRATGALAGSIRPAQRQSGVVVRAGGGSIRYAKYVEFGTRKMPGRSYLIRGVNESQPQWMDVYAVELQKLMDQVASSSDGTGE